MTLVVFIETFFTNNQDTLFQIGFVIVLINTSNQGNIFHWLSIKHEKIRRNVLALEIYVMRHEFHVATAIKSIIQKIFTILLLHMIICTNSKLLYNCLVNQVSLKKNGWWLIWYPCGGFISDGNHGDEMDQLWQQRHRYHNEDKTMLGSSSTHWY